MVGSSTAEPTEVPRGSSSSHECNDLRDPNTEVRFFCSDFLRGRGVVSLTGVVAMGVDADQPPVSEPAVPGRRLFDPSEAMLGL